MKKRNSKNRSKLLPLYRLASYKFFVPFAEKVAPIVFILSLIVAGIGVFSGLALAPADYQQGNSFRIIYIHVPAAILSTGLYVFIAFLSVIFLIWRIKIATVIARSAAILGATYTLITLVTGAIWGYPTWGTWWTWDVRLTSELILLFLYMGYILLDLAIEEREAADKTISILALIGLINVPIIKFSVYFFATLHQKSTLFAKGGPSMPFDMLYPLLLMLAAYILFSIGYICKRSVNYIYKEQLIRHYMK